MNFNVGQIKSTDLSNITNWEDGLKIGTVDKTIDGNLKEMRALYWGSENEESGEIKYTPFKSGKTYVLKIKYSLVSEDKESKSFAECEIYLSNMGSGDVDDEKKMSIKVLPYVSKDPQILTVIFTPHAEGFTHLIFELKNIQGEGVDSKLNIEGEDYIPIYSLNNICNEIANKMFGNAAADSNKIILTKIGLQGATGLPFSINGEDFKIGKSEIFTSDNIDIGFLGVFQESDSVDYSEEVYYTDKNFFILDFEYESTYVNKQK